MSLGKHLSAMFRIRGGVVPTELLGGPGLGFRWPSGVLPKNLAKLSKPLRILPHRDPISKSKISALRHGYFGLVETGLIRENPVPKQG